MSLASFDPQIRCLESFFQGQHCKHPLDIFSSRNRLASCDSTTHRSGAKFRLSQPGPSIPWLRYMVPTVCDTVTLSCSGRLSAWSIKLDQQDSWLVAATIDRSWLNSTETLGRGVLMSPADLPCSGKSVKWVTARDVATTWLRLYKPLSLGDDLRDGCKWRRLSSKHAVGDREITNSLSFKEGANAKADIKNRALNLVSTNSTGWNWVLIVQQKRSPCRSPRRLPGSSPPFKGGERVPVDMRTKCSQALLGTTYCTRSKLRCWTMAPIVICTRKIIIFISFLHVIIYLFILDVHFFFK